MRKRLVCLRHALEIFFLLHSASLIPGCIQKFQSQLLCHRCALPAAGSCNNPPDRERLLPLGRDFRRDLIHRAADALRADLNEGSGVQKCLLENLKGGILRALLHRFHRIPENSARDTLLAAMHEAVNELFDIWIGAFGDVALYRCCHNGSEERKAKSEE